MDVRGVDTGPFGHSNLLIFINNPPRKWRSARATRESEVRLQSGPQSPGFAAVPQRCCDPGPTIGPGIRSEQERQWSAW